MTSTNDAPIDGRLVGTQVRFTASRLGLLRNLDSTRFEEQTVTEGDLGIYEGKHGNPVLAQEGWHVIRVGDDDAPLYCPCHRSQFEFGPFNPLIDGRRMPVEEAVEPCVNNEGYELPGDRP